MKYWMAMVLLLASIASSATATVGQAAPVFSLTDQNGKTHSSDEFHGKWLVLYFYPKAGTPGCTEEACSFRDDIIVLRALGAEVVGISTDDVAAIHDFGTKQELPFTLLADTDGKVSESYGALTNLGLMKFAKRYTYLIDPNGKIVRFYKDIDTKTYAKTIAADLRGLVGKHE
ncbi:MAG: peroxiredoxin [Burkholderiales bacterium]|nr:peroxiredoxin [Burkholderiales bacterium]